MNGFDDETESIVGHEGMKRRGRRAADVVLVAALASGATQQQAAHQAQVSERTVRRRLGDPEFSGEIARLRSETIRGIAADLKTAAVTATATLVELLDSAVPAQVRLAAARTILDSVVRYHDATEVEDRIRELETEVFDDELTTRSA